MGGEPSRPSSSSSSAGFCSYSPMTFYSKRFWSGSQKEEESMGWWERMTRSFDPPFSRQCQEENGKNWRELSDLPEHRSLRLPSSLQLWFDVDEKSSEESEIPPRSGEGKEKEKETRFWIPLDFIWVHQCHVRTARGQVKPMTFYLNLLDLVRQIKQRGDQGKGDEGDSFSDHLLWNPISQQPFPADELDRMLSSYESGESKLAQFQSWLGRMTGWTKATEGERWWKGMGLMLATMSAFFPVIPLVVLKTSFQFLRENLHLWSALHRIQWDRQSLLRFTQAMEGFYSQGVHSLYDVPLLDLDQKLGWVGASLWVRRVFGGFPIHLLLTASQMLLTEREKRKLVQQLYDQGESQEDDNPRFSRTMARKLARLE